MATLVENFPLIHLFENVDIQVSDPSPGLEY